MRDMTTRSSFAIDVPAALLARAQQGEREAFEQLYRWFERPVFTLALRICGDRFDADEVLQETMLKVWSATSGSGAGGFRGDGGSPFWGWLRQVAVNESLMLLRRGRRLSVELHGVEADEHAEDHAPPPPAAEPVVADHTFSIVSCSTSSASPRSPQIRSARVNTGRSNQRYNCSNASRSPCCARASRAAGTSIAKLERVAMSLIQMHRRAGWSQPP